MTLPPGFGSRDQDRRMPTKKCKLGKNCDRSERCTLHNFTYYHDEAWLLIKIVLIFTFSIGGVVVGIIVYDAQWEASHEIIYRNIEGFNCDQLAEYVADKNESYNYAEHRYEWLCVNEQVKEFQG